MTVRAALATTAAMALVTISSAARGDAATAQAFATDCELHVWPTENYIGLSTGLLSAVAGPVGAVAEIDARKSRVGTIKDAMREYLGAEVQVEELRRIDAAAMLGLPGYRIVVEQPTPPHDDAKTDPAIRSREAEIKVRLASGERLSTSTTPCYAELIGSQIFYLKTFMYPGKLFSGWVFRTFPPVGPAVRKAQGAVKNSLREFPPKSPEMIEAAKADIRAVYARDFAEFVRKKVGRKVP